MSPSLTKPFSEHVRELAQGDPELRRLMLARAIRYLNGGDIILGKATLVDLINATVGFDALGKAVGKSPKSLRRMLDNGSNPRIATLYAVIDHLRKAEGVEIEVSCNPVKPRKKAHRKAAMPAGEMAVV